MISLFTALSLAIITNPNSSGSVNQIALPSGSTNATLDRFWSNGTNLFFSILSALALISILYAAFIYVTAGSSQDKIKRAKTILTNTILGVALLVSSYVILSLLIAIGQAIARSV